MGRRAGRVLRGHDRCGDRGGRHGSGREQECSGECEREHSRDRGVRQRCGAERSPRPKPQRMDEPTTSYESDKSAHARRSLVRHGPGDTLPRVRSPGDRRCCPCGRHGRKVRAPQGRVVGNAHRPRIVDPGVGTVPQKPNRRLAASASRRRNGKGETVRQERHRGRGRPRPTAANPTRRKTIGGARGPRTPLQQVVRGHPRGCS